MIAPVRHAEAKATTNIAVRFRQKDRADVNNAVLLKSRVKRHKFETFWSAQPGMCPGVIRGDHVQPAKVTVDTAGGWPKPLPLLTAVPSKRKHLPIVYNKLQEVDEQTLSGKTMPNMVVRLVVGGTGLRCFRSAARSC